MSTPILNITSDARSFDFDNAPAALRYFAENVADFDRNPLLLTDSRVHGEVVAASVPRVEMAVVRRSDGGAIDADHLRELLRPSHISHFAKSTRSVLGCFTVRRDDPTDLDDLAALMVDTGGRSIFDYSCASADAVVDLTPHLTRRWDASMEGQTWRNVRGDVVGVSYKHIHDWKYAVITRADAGVTLTVAYWWDLKHA